jgi:hypothetical protein
VSKKQKPDDLVDFLIGIVLTICILISTGCMIYLALEAT